MKIVFRHPMHADSLPCDCLTQLHGTPRVTCLTARSPKRIRTGRSIVSDLSAGLCLLGFICSASVPLSAGHSAVEWYRGQHTLLAVE